MLHILLFSELIGIVGLSATEVLSCCLGNKVMCPCVYAVVFQIFVSFVLQCKFVCKVQFISIAARLIVVVLCFTGVNQLLVE